ncbi:MAG: DNA primase [Desulfomonilaceae bacterium]|nr:DNA primase [Desulfomonilaceae bacterium]
MRISEAKIAEVAGAADIVHVISGYVTLKKAGKDYRGVCPFHGDTDPSFYVSPQKGIFKCFGCGAGGRVFHFIMKMENVSFVESVRMLAARYGVPFRLEEGRGRPPDERDRLVRALNSAQSYFTQNLKRNSAAGEYLTNRGVPDEWIDRIGFGFAPDSWEGMADHLRSVGVDHRDATLAGLIKSRASGGHYDVFRSRITVPITDLNSAIVAFGGRILGPGEPKYLNSPESPVFQKKNTLYGLDGARDSIRREGFIVVVEGYFDQISLMIGGVENTVAPLGTALGAHQVRLMKRFSENVITVFDGDEAGLRAVKRSIPVFIAQGIEPRCVILKEDKDPDEAVRRLGGDGFRDLLDAAESMVDFLLGSIQAQYDLGTLSGRNLALEECLPVLREIADSKERDYLIERFSSRIRVREERLRRVLSAGKHKRRDDGPKPVGAMSLFDLPADERNVVRGMLLREGFIDRVLEAGVIKDIDHAVLRTLAEMMAGFRRDHGVFDSMSFFDSLHDQDLAALVAGWLHPKREEDDLRPDVEPDVDGDLTLDESMDRIRGRKLIRRKEEIQERMKRCPPEGEEFGSLCRELLAIGKRLGK